RRRDRRTSFFNPSICFCCCAICACCSLIALISSMFRRSYLTPVTSPLSSVKVSDGATFATSSAPSPMSGRPSSFQLKLIGRNCWMMSKPERKERTLVFHFRLEAPHCSRSPLTLKQTDAPDDSCGMLLIRARPATVRVRVISVVLMPTFPIKLVLPTTCRRAMGLVVPIPTLVLAVAPLTPVMLPSTSELL